jgi:phospholipase/lecithinase/hemolysin
MMEACKVPVNQYFWLNNLHPTYPVHAALAAQIAETLNNTPASPSCETRNPVNESVSPSARFKKK